MLSEFPAKISGACKTRFFRDNGNGFLRRVELLGSLCQPVPDEVGNRGALNARLENMQRTAFTDGRGVRNHLKGDFLRVMVMNILHHCLQSCLFIIETAKVFTTGGCVELVP